MTITTTSGSVVATPGESFALSSLFTLSGTPYSQIEIRLFDDNNYAASNPGAYGSLSGNGATLSLSATGGTDTSAEATFTYNAANGQYVNATYGSLSQLTYTAPTGVNHGEMLSVLAQTNFSSLDVADLYTVVQSAAAMPMAATPGGLCAIAQSYVGQTWNIDGCWLLTADIAARAGASVPATSAFYSSASHPLVPRPNGEWIVVYNGTTQSNPSVTAAESVLRPGDILSLGWQVGTAGHSLTVVSGYGLAAQVIDNSGPAASDGSSNDIVIQSAHSLVSELVGDGDSADPASIQIYRLDTPTIAVTTASSVVAPAQSLALAPLFSAQDAGGAGTLPITQYAFYDVASGGKTADSFTLAGVTHSATSQSGALIVTAAELSQVALAAGSSTGSETVYVSAFNGSYWGDWQSFTVSVAAVGSAAQSVAQFEAGGLAAPVTVSDSANAVLASLSGLQQMAAAGDLASLTLTDGASAALSVTAGQATADQSALARIVGSHKVAVADSAADIMANLPALQSLAAAGVLSGISVSDGAPLALGATAATTDAAALALLSTGGKVAVTDSAANVAANLDGLQTLAAGGHLASITLNDGGTPILAMSASQAAQDTQALATIGSAHGEAIASTIVGLTIASGNALYGGLALDAAGNLYGTAFQGGTFNDGVLFEIAKSAGGYASTATILSTFGGGSGANPRGNMYGVTSGASTVFYGTTLNGGTGNDGTIFMATSTGTITTLASFNGTNGAQPYGNVIADANGDLFGTTSAGGASGDGTVFELVKTSSGYAAAPTTLATFNGSNGSELYCSLTADANGDLFGMTETGGANNLGTLCEIAKTATGYAPAPATLASFTGANGANPHGTAVMDANGDIFGVTQNGGSGSGGVVFEIVKTAGGYAATPVILANFGGAVGADLENVTLDAAGNIFGTAFSGGSANDGTVFEIAKTATGYAASPTVLLNFTGTNGANPHGSLIIDSQGDLIGTTETGGNGGGGVVFEISGVAVASLQSAAATLQAWSDGEAPQQIDIIDRAAAVQSNLDALESIAAAGRLTSIALSDSGIPAIALSATQVTKDAGVLSAITGPFDLLIAAGATSQTIDGLANHGTTIVFAGPAADYTLTPSGDGVSLTVAGNGLSDHVGMLTALQFGDVTDFVASQTPAKPGGVSSFQVTTLYAAVLDRVPDVAGLAYYENLAAANPAIPITTYAEDFLQAPEYASSPAHAYAQSSAGDAQFLTDTYANLLHRAPQAGDVAWYQANVIAPILAGATPGTAAYASAELAAHAAVLADFSQSLEFKGDVQVTAQTPSSSQHWLVLI